MGYAAKVRQVRRWIVRKGKVSRTPSKATLRAVAAKGRRVVRANYIARLVAGEAK